MTGRLPMDRPVPFDDTPSPVPPSLRDAARVWGRIGILSFGGPAAQIALMHREIVEARHWLSERQFLNALSFCMLLPGPEAMQLATYAGWRMHGVVGGLIAGLLFVVPGALVIMALAAIYALYGSVPLVQTLFVGVKAAILIIVVEALLRVSKRALVRKDHWIVAMAAFVAIFFLDLSFPLIVLAAGLYGFAVSRAAAPPETNFVSRSGSNPLATAAVWSAIWVLPLVAISILAPQSVLDDIGLFFSKLAVVTFGGAYAVLAYMAQDVVEHFGWLTAGQMMDGLGLAETTPGPLILVTQFVGFLAGYAEGGMWLAIAAALVTLWATFAPCFLWIFLGAPYVDWITAQPRLNSALTAITAAVVGVILNLSIWFGLHVVFQDVSKQTFGPLQIWTPDTATLDWRVIVLAIVSGILLLRLHLNIVLVLGISCLGGVALSLIG